MLKEFEKKSIFMISQKLKKILIITKLLQKPICNSFIVLFLIISCTKTKNPFILSSTKNVEILEEKDHIFCNSLLKNYEKKELIKDFSYWNCRLLTTKHHLINSNDAFATSHNAQIIELLKRISSILKNLPESLIIHSNNRIDEQHHAKCLKAGYKITKQNQAEIDDYFSCRQSLLEDYKAIPPFFNSDYLDYKNKNYNIDFVINKRMQKSIYEFEEQKEKYPNCVKFNLYSLNFQNCTKAYDESRICHSEIAKKKNKKILEAKTHCQKQAYIHFPDELIKVDEKNDEESKKNNISSDYYNQNSLSSLGLSVKDFSSKIDDQEKEKQKEEPKNLEDINNYKHLYTKLEIGNLRSIYAGNCQKEVDVEISRYVKSLEMACDELTKFKVIGEDL